MCLLVGVRSKLIDLCAEGVLSDSLCVILGESFLDSVQVLGGFMKYKFDIVKMLLDCCFCQFWSHYCVVSGQVVIRYVLGCTCFIAVDD